MMASSCPFQRSSVHVLSNGTSLKRSLTSRQSSIQIPQGEAEQDDEDKNTLNLKHLNAAILLLTSPPVRIIFLFNFASFTLGDISDTKQRL
ncbi:hypothetical protein WA026_016248 [Henosepilachna vigintioctopunctata]|uniref:Uncharacterized protein n=1 Tax=Henosepilachna vigintioctopunctata TaxID=420089 RepID=A0AAW1TN50_9CUCU